MNSKTIRGDSERQVEVKVKEFIYRREEHGEDWTAGIVEYSNARILGFKPYKCVVTRND